jgi:drug/metabolite transporter (DMT)-like permease
MYILFKNEGAEKVDMVVSSENELMKRTEKRKAYIYLIMTFILWGSLYVVSKYTLSKIPTFTLSFLRFCIAFVTLTMISGKKKQTKKIEKKDIPYLFLIGVGGYFIAVGAQLLGTKYSNASLASLINSLNPLTMTLFAAIILHEKLTRWKIIGLVIALIGVYIILGGGNIGGFLGIGLSLFSVLLWSVISVFMRKITQKYDAILITRYGISIAVVCYLPLCICELYTGSSVHFDISCVLAVLYMGSICTGVAYILWNKSLSMMEAGSCSSFYPVQPLVSAFLGILFLHEQAAVTFWIGAIFIIVGIMINLHKKIPHVSNLKENC